MIQLELFTELNNEFIYWNNMRNFEENEFIYWNNI